MQEVALFANERPIFSIDFENSAIGSRAITDKVTMRTLTRRVITSGGVDGVVNHATHGKMYQFDSKSYFDLPGPIEFNSMNYQIDMAYLADNLNGHVLFSTGGYPGSGPVSGVTMGFGQYADRYIQYFQVEEVSKLFQRVTCPGPWRYVLEKVSIRKDNNGVRIWNETAGTESSYPPFDTVKDTWFMLGANRNATGVYAGFSGFLKYLRVKKLK